MDLHTLKEYYKLSDLRTADPLLNKISGNLILIKLDI